MWRVIIRAALLLGGFAVSAATVQLKDQASVSGKILAEKPGEIIVDIGYTVLIIPRDQILSLVADGASVPKPGPTSPAKPVENAPSAGAPSAAVAGGGSDFYKNATGRAPERTVRELAAVLGSAVAQVRTPSGLGSGFFVNEDGFLITNFHVVEGETEISLEVYLLKNGVLDRQDYKKIRIVALNKFADLALLKVEDSGAPKFSSVTLGDSDALGVGERVFAIGSPLGLERTVTEGIVSTKTRQFEGELYLQTTAQINPGNSGGPLFDLRGEVVGITNMKITSGEGLGFAIPVEAVKFFLKHRDSFAYDNDNPSNGYRYLPPPGRVRADNAQ